MPGLVVPHFKGYGDSVSKPRERKPSPDLLVGDVRREQTFKSPSERRRGGRVSIGQADCERVEKHVDRPWRRGGGWPRPRGGRDRGRTTEDLNVAHHGAPERREVGLTGERGIESLEATRRAQEQGARVAAPLLR